MPDEASQGTSFATLTLRTFVDRLGSAEPVPGGGSASAVAASLGAALVTMVARLSQGRAKYMAHAALHERAIDVGQRLSLRFLELADQDATAYATFAAAAKLPRDTDEERSARSAALGAAARVASEVPLATVEACLELAVTAEVLAGRSNVNASSDLNVAAQLAEAAARGAAENVLVNLPAVDDEAFAKDTTDQVMAWLDTIVALAAETHQAVRSGSPRDPLPA
jgi:glutamate formiminotransferase/formiminotetrahydrofolate cyclodeaminase